MPSGPTRSVSEGILGRLDLRRTPESGRPHLSNPPAATDAPIAPEEPQAGRSQDEINRQNARTQFNEGESASRLLHGAYLGDLVSALAARLTGTEGRNQQAARAIRAYSNAISLDPSLIEAVLGRARVYCFLRRYADAKADLQRAEGSGLAAAIGKVEKLERRTWAMRVVVLAAVTGACALWRVETSHILSASNGGESTRRVEESASILPSPPQLPGQSLPSAPAAMAAAPAEPRELLRQPGELLPQARGIYAEERQVATEPFQSETLGVTGNAMLVPAQSSDRTCNDAAMAAPNCVPSLLGPVVQAPRIPKPPIAATNVQPLEAACEDCPSARQNQVDANASLPEPSKSSLAALAAIDRDEVEMIKLACRSSGQGVETHDACIESQIASLAEAMPMPKLTVLPALDRQLIQRACSGSTQGGPALYRRCISRQLIGLAGAPEIPDLSAFSAERKRAVELACRNSANSGPAGYHTCLDRQAKQWRRGLSQASRAVAEPKQLDR